MTQVDCEAHQEFEEDTTLFFRVKYVFVENNYGQLVTEIHRGPYGFNFRVWHTYRGKAVELSLDPSRKSPDTVRGQHGLENRLIEDIALWAFNCRS